MSTALVDRLRNAVLKPADPDMHPATPVAPPKVVEQLEIEARSADDKERLIGLVAAPLAAAIGLLIVGALIANDPAALLKNGQINHAHVSVSLYESLGGVLFGMSVLMLGMAWFRKRMFLGIITALYGLAIFNLHFWGFGVPFVMVGSWLLVRAYRAQKALKSAEEAPTYRDSSMSRSGQPNGRYTPASARKR